MLSNDLRIRCQASRPGPRQPDALTVLVEHPYPVRRQTGPLLREAGRAARPKLVRRRHGLWNKSTQSASVRTNPKILPTFWLLCLTGMRPEEAFEEIGNRWEVEADGIRIHGTKSAAAGRLVPTVAGSRPHPAVPPELLSGARAEESGPALSTDAALERVPAGGRGSARAAGGWVGSTQEGEVGGPAKKSPQKSPHLQRPGELSRYWPWWIRTTINGSKVEGRSVRLTASPP